MSYWIYLTIMRLTMSKSTAPLSLTSSFPYFHPFFLSVICYSLHDMAEVCEVDHEQDYQTTQSYTKIPILPPFLIIHYPLQDESLVVVENCEIDH